MIKEEMRKVLKEANLCVHVNKLKFDHFNALGKAAEVASMDTFTPFYTYILLIVCSGEVGFG